MYKDKKNSEEDFQVWDVELAPINFPSFIRKKYELNYCKNRKQYNLWIDRCSKLQKTNIDWWMTLPSYRNPYICNIFNYLAVLDTLFSIKNKRINLKIVTSSKQLSNLINHHFKSFCKIELKQKNVKLSLIINYCKCIIFQLVTFFFINIFFKKTNYEKKKIILVDQFVTHNEKQNSNFYKKFSDRKNLRTLIAPTLIPTINFLKLFKNLFKLKKRENLIFKEHYLKLNDLVFSFGHIFRRGKFFKSKINYKNFDLTNLLLEETIRYDDFFSISSGILNYLFFKRTSLKKINFVKSINWFENQIVDKGWNLGFRTFYSRHEKFSFGYQDFSKHYNLMSNSPTEFEYKSKATPEKLIIISNIFKKITKEFYSKQKIIVGESWRFKYFKNHKAKKRNNKKRKIFLLVLCGIKEIDIELLKLVSETCRMNPQINIFYKSHPILDIKKISKNINLASNLLSVNDNLQDLIQNSLACITSGPSSTILENSTLGHKLIVLNIEAGTRENLKIFKLKKQNYFFVETSKQLLAILAKLNKF